MRLRQVSARFRPHRWPDSSALQPLHSISLQLRRLRFRSIRSDGHKLPRPARTPLRPEIQETRGRDAPHIGQSAIWPRDFVRPRHQQYGARLRLSPKTAAIARDASHGQDAARVAVTASFHGAPQAALAKLADPAGKIIWSDTTAAGCGQVCRARPCTHRVAAHALRSDVVESKNWLRAGATVPGIVAATSQVEVTSAARLA